jgi:hypothetical protein
MATLGEQEREEMLRRAASRSLRDDMEYPVCADMSDGVTRRRESASLQKAAKEHPGATLHVVSLEPETPADVPPGIAVHAASRWLLREGEA